MEADESEAKYNRQQQELDDNSSNSSFIFKEDRPRSLSEVINDKSSLIRPPEIFDNSSLKPQNMIESSSEESSNNNEGGLSEASSDDGEGGNSKQQVSSDTSSEESGGGSSKRSNLLLVNSTEQEKIAKYASED